MPGSGKTHFGRRLAAVLKMSFLDLDQLIEKEEGMSIRQIVEEKGEAGFREMEAKVLRTTEHLYSVVISCGGGTPIYNENMGWIKNRGLVLWINTDLEIICKRIAQNLGRRPMFVGLSDVELERKIHKIYVERAKIYAKSDLQVKIGASSKPLLNLVIQKIMLLNRNKNRRL